MTTSALLQNRQIRLAARPRGVPTPDCWAQTTETITPNVENGVLVQTLLLSLDPAMRGWMNEGKSYIPSVALGDVMRAGGVGRVVASTLPQFRVGDLVSGGLGVQQYARFDAGSARHVGLTRIDPALGSLAQWLNVLGMPGMTAYFGLTEIGQPKAGETLVVSGAAGAVGQSVGQLAKLRGCRVVGIAGGAAKCDFVVRELGFDACIDYKQGEGAVRDGLKTHCPEGVDIYFDNVGGDILDQVLARIRRHARIVICGAISQYNATAAMQGPKNYLALLVHRARMEGMVVFDYADRYPMAVSELAGHLRSGRMKSREDIVEGGIDAFPEALLRLFRGENFGKLVLRVASD